MDTDVEMRTDTATPSDLVGLRYRLTGVITRTDETTTWRAQDTWLEQPVVLVTPEPRSQAHFEAVTACLRASASPHLVELYDAAPSPADFAALHPPRGVMADGWRRRDEDEVLVAGSTLGEALAALHEQGVAHGRIHPGTVVEAPGGALALSPWPLAPQPPGWDDAGDRAGAPADPGPLSEPDIRHDVRALGALLLAALAGPPILSLREVESRRDELTPLAPAAVAVAEKALTPPDRGGYRTARELGADCAGRLENARPTVRTAPAPIGPLGTAPVAPLADSGTGREAETVETVETADGVDRPEGRRMAVVVAGAAAAILVASATGALSGTTARHEAAIAKLCVHRTCATGSGGPVPLSSDGQAGPVAAPSSSTAASPAPAWPAASPRASSEGATDPSGQDRGAPSATPTDLPVLGSAAATPGGFAASPLVPGPVHSPPVTSSSSTPAASTPTTTASRPTTATSTSPPRTTPTTRPTPTTTTTTHTGATSTTTSTTGTTSTTTTSTTTTTTPTTTPTTTTTPPPPSTPTTVAPHATSTSAQRTVRPPSGGSRHSSRPAGAR